MKSALIIGGSKGIGSSIVESLKNLNIKIISPSRKELDTSKISTVKKFIKKVKIVDYLILNTGGPPAKDFFFIKEKEWHKYHNQLFLSFVLILQNLSIKKNGFIFLISSHTIKTPENNLTLSNSYRLAFSSILKTISHLYAKKNITCLNIAPGPINTMRLRSLVKNLKKFEKNLPLRRSGKPEEIGLFIKSIIKNDIKYLNGVIINFDGGLSKSLI